MPVSQHSHKQGPDPGTSEWNAAIIKLVSFVKISANVCTWISVQISYLCIYVYKWRLMGLLISIEGIKE